MTTVKEVLEYNDRELRVCRVCRNAFVVTGVNNPPVTSDYGVYHYLVDAWLCNDCNERVVKGVDA